MDYTVMGIIIAVTIYLMMGRGTVLMIRHLDGDPIPNIAMLWVPLIAIVGVIKICLIGEEEFIRQLKEDYYE